MYLIGLDGWLITETDADRGVTQRRLPVASQSTYHCPGNQLKGYHLIINFHVEEMVRVNSLSCTEPRSLKGDGRVKMRFL